MNQKQEVAGGFGAENNFYSAQDDDFGTLQTLESMLEGQHSDEEIRRFVQQQKQLIKKTQEKLEIAKRQYRNDKKKYTD